jgi:putative serine protease PepD
VVAIGSPFSLPETVTSGIVSQTGRVIQAPTNPPYSIPDAIQTDAAINPGNSGGPLLNADGEVLGLNDQIDTNTSSATGQGQNAGIGFATPSNEDQQVAGELIAGKTVQHAYIGLSLEPPQQLTTSNASSAVVKQITPGGPAAKAGLQVNDVVTKLDSTPVTTTDGLISLLARYTPGTTVTLTVDRNGQSKQIKVTLANRPKTVGSGG